MVILGGGGGLMSEVPLYLRTWHDRGTCRFRAGREVRAYEALGQLGQDEPASG